MARLKTIKTGRQYRKQVALAQQTGRQKLDFFTRPGRLLIARVKLIHAYEVKQGVTS